MLDVAALRLVGHTRLAIETEPCVSTRRTVLGISSEPCDGLFSSNPPARISILGRRPSSVVTTVEVASLGGLRGLYAVMTLPPL